MLRKNVLFVLFFKYINDIESFMIERNGSGIISIINDVEVFLLDMGFWFVLVWSGVD